MFFRRLRQPTIALVLYFASKEHARSIPHFLPRSEISVS